jgi:hypothetical protein
MLGAVAEGGQRGLDLGEAGFDGLLAHVLEQRDRTECEPLEVLGEGRRAKPGDVVTRDGDPSGAREIAADFHFGPELGRVDRQAGTTRNHQTSGIASEKFDCTKRVPPGLTTRCNSWAAR